VKKIDIYTTVLFSFIGISGVALFALGGVWLLTEDAAPVGLLMGVIFGFNLIVFGGALFLRDRHLRDRHER
jgi:hypothetical protein